MAPGRGAEVPKGHFDKLQRDLVEVVLVCDRYSAYKSFAKSMDELILAYCWAHVRRDFLKAARSWPELEEWMWSWVNDIGTLSQLNGARLKAWDAALPLVQQPVTFVVSATTSSRATLARCRAAARRIFRSQPSTVPSAKSSAVSRTTGTASPSLSSARKWPWTTIPQNGRCATRSWGARILMALGGCGARIWPRCC